jgi:low affinity Fe/Cu permease
MKNKNKNESLKRRFERFSSRITKVTGTPAVFLIACLTVVVWGLLGPVFHYSDTWQLVINTGTTIITFLMVFVIQQSQNKDTMALQLKLNELIAATRGASNRLIDIEDVSEEELMIIKDFYIHLARLARKEMDIRSSHSIDEASAVHALKLRKNKDGATH